MPLIYLDNNATTRPADEVTQAMVDVCQHAWGNPSSVHRFGQLTRQRVELARAQVASLIGCKEREVIFTSGGTESNHLAIHGVLDAFAAAAGKPQSLITLRVEHSAVREPAAKLEAGPVQVVYLPVDIDGRTTPEALRDALVPKLLPDSTVLVSVQWVNNETGVIQPLKELVQAARAAHEQAAAQGVRSRLVLHTDATQAAGKLVIHAKDLGVDLLTFSGHKLHGPKGVGVLYVRTGVKLKPVLLGGPQERDRRAGTENTTGIVGLGVAAELAGKFLADAAWLQRQKQLRDRLEQAITQQLPGTVINSAQQGDHRIWNTSNLGFPRLEAEAILLALSERGVCASAGAACSSGSLEPSPVLRAMGIPDEVAHGSVRFSLSRETTQEEVDQAAAMVVDVVQKLRRTLPT